MNEKKLSDWDKFLREHEGEWKSGLDENERPVLIAESWRFIEAIVPAFSKFLAGQDVDHGLIVVEYGGSKIVSQNAGIVDGLREYVRRPGKDPGEDLRAFLEDLADDVPPFEINLEHILKAAGFATKDYAFCFTDDTGVCEECGHIFANSPTSYAWTPKSYCFCEGYGPLVCLKCLKEKHKEDYLDDYKAKILRGDTPGVFLLDPKDFGLAPVEEYVDYLGENRPVEFENGWHGGQTDDPKAQAKKLAAHGIEDFVFEVSPGQFDVSWKVHVRPEHLEKAKKLLVDNPSGTKLDYDPAERMKTLLKTAPMIQSTPGAVAVTKIDVANNRATAKLVSNDDFIAGKALDD